MGDFSGSADFSQDDFPDDSTDNERFSGSAAAWLFGCLVICLILTVIGIVVGIGG